MWPSTLDAMDDELVTDSLVYRYDPARVAGRAAGLEGTFSLCTFNYVDALARAGRLDEARLVFEKMLTYANHLGLYSEEIGLTGRAARQLPAGLHAPGADRRGHHAGRRAGSREVQPPVRHGRHSGRAQRGGRGGDRSGGHS